METPQPPVAPATAAGASSPGASSPGVTAAPFPGSGTAAVADLAGGADHPVYSSWATGVTRAEAFSVHGAVSHPAHGVGLGAGAVGQTDRTPAALALPCPGRARVTGPAPGCGISLCPPANSQTPAIAAMWERCSLATRTARFHAPVRNFPASYLKVVLADPAASVVAVLEPTGAVVALASLIPSASGDGAEPGVLVAELGVLVEDAWQRRGIGRRLVAHLITGAPGRGITALTASVLTQNASVADQLRRLPGDFTVTSHGSTLTVLVRLAAAGSRR